MSEKYTLRISRTTVDKLGIKLYDRVAAAVAELIANSYDADAENVTIHLPLNKYLARQHQEKIIDQGYEIIVEDDGHGFTQEEANALYLLVGKERRSDPRQGPKSRYKQRPVLGRKGIGKLAPFGVCNEIEVWSASGEPNKPPYQVANFILKYEQIVHFDVETEYHPSPGEDDGKLVQKTGTKITLRNFYRKKTPNKETFHSQLSRRFSIGLPDFEIHVNDTTGGTPTFSIGDFEIEIMENTRIDLDDRPITVYRENDDGEKTEEVEELLPIRGWVAFSKQSYRNDLMAGVRIYTRGKLSSVTRDFGIKSGFTGENTIRSYLVGEIHAEWIDEDGKEDLNQTSRQDILWGTVRGQAFQDWGRVLLRDLGRLSRTPVQEKNWYLFLEKTKFNEKAETTLPSNKLIERAKILGKLIGGRISADELEDDTKLNQIAEVVIAVTPQFEWIDTYAEITSKEIIDLEEIAELFASAKIGEITILGNVASRRLGAIRRLQIELDKEPEVDEKILQNIIEESPWLINPQWTVFGITETFKTVRGRFERWYKNEYEEEIVTSTLNEDNKIPDFVLLHPGLYLEIVEIKRRWHKFSNSEYQRLDNYVTALDTFLSINEDFRNIFSDKCHAILVCDDLNLSGTDLRAYNSLIDSGQLEKITWDAFLTRTINSHQDFITELRIRTG